MNKQAILTNVRKKMKEAGMTEGRLLMEARVSRETWERYQAGRQPTAYALWRIARALGCRMETLLEGIEDDE